MNSQRGVPDHVRPIAGWACVSIGVGFVTVLTILVVAVRMLG
jgi:hypothetical protein